jgi:hypothetical protein
VVTARRPPLLLTNLLNDLEALGSLLVERIAAADLLNAFLLAAGMQQVADDHVHSDPGLRDRAAGGRLWWWRVGTSRHLAPAAWLADLEGLVQRLAGGLVDQAAWETPCRRPDLGAEAEALVSRLRRLPAPLRLAVVRLPGCFRSFDQAPEDLEALAAAFAGRWPEASGPVLVVGVRSSGCYLAPLVAASLGRHGCGDVRVATLRPGQRWLRHEQPLLRRAAAAGGRALLVDDPPQSWGSVTRAAQALAGFGFGRRRIVLLLATFASAAQPPAALGEHPAVLLPFASWAIRRRLEPERVRDVLARLLPDGEAILAVRPAGDLPAGTWRGHAEAVYEVAFRATGGPERRLVRARGVGLGYFGEHALAVAQRLRGRVSGIHGLERGILYEAWAPPATRLAGPRTGGRAA